MLDSGGPGFGTSFFCALHPGYAKERMEFIMNEERTSVFTNALIWFGAAVSIAEILTGTLLAPLGFGRGLAAILLGHVIGCVPFCLAGLIGGYTRRSAMETVKISFGLKGSLLFSTLNVLQLVGWTAVMICSGGSAANSVYSLSTWLWIAVIGALVVVWLFIGLKNMSKINIAAMSALFALTVVLSLVISRGGGAAAAPASLSFGAAVELAAAMPLSWLPLVADYTRAAEKPAAASVASTLVYFAVSCWMYAIGMSASLFTGESDVAAIMTKAGLGAAALYVVILSTVTTTFLDAYSAGVSSASISRRIPEKPAAVVVCVIGTLLAAALAYSQTNALENFLYLIGSVFAPMIAILITDFFILKKDSSARAFNILNLFVWAAGFAVYRFFMTLDTPVGNTLPVMLITGIICLAANKISGARDNV